MRPDRRTLLTRGAAIASGLALAGRDRLASSESVAGVLEKAESLTRNAQRLLVGDALAPEYSATDVSAHFKANGTTNPQDEDYRAHVQANFANYRLSVGGLVERPLELSLAELRALPARTQITRHDCVEGWSCIGQWTGVPLREVIGRAGAKPQARYVVFRCFDDMERGYLSPPGKDDDASDGTDSDAAADDTGDAARPAAEAASAITPFSGDVGMRYYESLDLREALHPQTILAYAMNGETLPVAHGAPLRLRAERQLGYKMAKYLRSIEVVADFSRLGKGKGGYWEDRGYEWYAGI